MTVKVTTMPHITTADRVGDHLRKSMRLRGVPAGTTVGALIDAIAKLVGTHGLSDEIASIEFGVMVDGSGRLGCEVNDDGKWEFREVRA